MQDVIDLPAIGDHVLNTDRILSLSAILISAVALIVAIWQGAVSREHNRLSVKPNILLVPVLEGKGGKNGIYITNAGLGPGIIKRAILKINDTEFDLTKNTWPEILKQIGIKPICFSQSWLPVGSTIMAAEEVALIKVTREELGACYLEAVKLITKRSIKITIHYLSMYKEDFTYSGSTVLDKDDFNFSKMIP